jgi:hypothetical protein
MAIVDYINIYCNSLMDLMSIVNEQLYICTEHIDYNLTTDIKWHYNHMKSTRTRRRWQNNI